jgi:glycosyltransferase involved in cell wall biosynthesis
MITVYTIAYNEEQFIGYFIKWYRDRFKDCRIVVYDNESTDNTVQICLDNNVEVISYSTNGKLSDSKYLEIKNNCWRDARTEWVVVCDVDELLSIRPKTLNRFNEEGVTVVKAIGYTMVKQRGVEYKDVCMGVRDLNYDKPCLFNVAKVNRVKYTAGCHRGEFQGVIKISESNRPPLYHHKYMDIDKLVDRYKMYSDRLSDENKRKMWGFHYQWSKKKIRDEYNNVLKRAKIVKPLREPTLPNC